MQVSHSAFCDESNYNTGTFRAIGVVSLSESDRLEVEATVGEIVRTSKIRELKWKGLSSADACAAAVAVAKYAVSLAQAGRLRIDILSWRGALPTDLKTHRKPTETLGVMYYWALKTTLSQKWPPTATWDVRVDQQSAVDWDFLRRLVDPPAREVSIARADDHLVVEPIERFSIGSMSQCVSHSEPLVQLADLFAGVSGFSREHARRQQRWARGQQEELLGVDRDPNSRAHRARFKFMRELKSALKTQELDVRLWRDGFVTLDPAVPINFWHWKPVKALQSPQATLARPF